MKRLVGLLIILLVFLMSPVFSQVEPPSNLYAVEDTLTENIGLFEKNEILHLSLRFDITQYTRKKPKEEYLAAILTYHINNKDSVNKNIRIKSRGEFRNEFCAFPPIMINLKKTENRREDMKKIEKVKLVTHCKSGNEDNLLKEYLIYKLYNVLTDVSFRARLVKIDYINTAKKNKTVTAFGFLIEPVNVLAERTKMVEVESVTLGQKNMVPDQLDRMAIFNYLIGNADWSIPNQHNCKILLQPNTADSNLGTPVPYDFDYTGMVNASYAIPNETSQIKDVTERIYTGTCRSRETFEKEMKEFVENKAAFYQIITDFPYLSERGKKEMIKYLDDFYEECDPQMSIIDSFLKTCKDL
jgi:hypothetical protein